ncbi:bifunctional diaminohydroxyphosphoribosylaminopyrimidine deaminase/5-amino-6-(5-phosphoribosylamino)uracil reductase RibD [Planctomycetota bacterium]|nr:bifunctional diaminohydroxyphosphoribosylaminopyrimidine deaminase/5-amino-6-(5-phosphoribosylamino)uracil reductase RibD [Planctomycetota bacterium]
MPQDRRFMWRALELARRGRPYVAPNPMVGCVITKGDEIIGEGFHEGFGKPHAEVNALEAAGEAADGADMYVSLEPCCESFEGKQTPPCVPQIIAAGIKRVVVATEDPHQNVRGKGIAMLRDAGIDVVLGECGQEAVELNAAFFSLMQRGRPLVTAKWAMTMDGKIATRSGDARWISGEHSRSEVHQDRASTGAIVLGVNTANQDDPQLSARGVEGRQPLRVVIDTKLKLNRESKLVATANEQPVFVYASENADEEKAKKLEAAGVYVIMLPEHDGHLLWPQILMDLGNRRVSSVIIEGGGGIFASAFMQRAIDRVKIYMAPKIFGGADATTPVEGAGVPNVERAITFENTKTRTLGDDVVIEGHVQYPEDDEPSESGTWKGYGAE